MKSNADIPLPPEADLPKGPWEHPSWAPLYLYLGCVIALALVAIALEASGWGAAATIAGTVLAIVSLLLLVAGFAVGAFIVRRFVSHTPDSFRAADPPRTAARRHALVPSGAVSHDSVCQAAL